MAPVLTAAIDRFQVRIGRGQDADDAGAELARFFEQPDAFLAGHALVGHQQADFVLVLFQELEALLGAGRR